LKDKLTITAYEVVEQPMTLRVGERNRDWIEALPERFAYRCLPLTMANQVGWELLNPVSFTARWNGKNGLDAIDVRFHGESSPLIGSHFGHGVLTFTLGYLFRTTKAHNLWVKGPANRPKDGIAPLEGIIETDWTPFTFTMNWQFTRDRQNVTFAQDEPVCTIFPYPRHYARKFDAVRQPIGSDPKLYQQYVAWRNDRLAFNEKLKEAGSDAQKEGWQRKYMTGRDMEGRAFAGHETKLRMQEFKRR
jgi:hypothetical protein